MKPEIICHIMSSVDGRLLPSRWTPPFDGTDPSKLFKARHRCLDVRKSDGQASEPSIFEYLGATDERPAAGQSLELLSSETTGNSIVWLRYRFHRKNS